MMVRVPNVEQGVLSGDTNQAPISARSSNGPPHHLGLQLVSHLIDAARNSLELFTWREWVVLALMVATIMIGFTWLLIGIGRRLH